MLLSSLDVLQKGLCYVGIGREKQARLSYDRKVKKFSRKHYGSSPLDVADIWYDLCHTSIEEARLSEKEKSERDLSDT